MPTETPFGRYEIITFEVIYQPKKKLPEFLTNFAISDPNWNSVYDITVPSQAPNDRVLTLNVEFAPGYFQTGKHTIFAAIGIVNHDKIIEQASASCRFTVKDGPPTKMTLADFSNPVTLRVNPKTSPD